MTRSPHSALGRVWAVLVLGQGETAKAVLTTITARLRKGNGRRRLLVRGPVQLDDELVDHLTDTVLPIVDRFAALLRPQVRRPTFDIAITNLAAASAIDCGLLISGFSADAAIFLAMLSALLELPVPQTVVCSAHIGSFAGDLLPVKNLGAKVEAACKGLGIETFLYGSLDADRSLAVLAPELGASAAGALRRARSQLRQVPVKDVAQLLPEVFSVDDLVPASLRVGYFELPQPLKDDGSIILKAAQWLTGSLDQSFWRILESHLLRGEGGAARDLLSLRAQYHLRRRQYPELGKRLLEFLRSLPPDTVPPEGLFPLLPPKISLDLGRLATPADYDDLQDFFGAVDGRLDTPTTPLLDSTPPPEAIPSAVAESLATVLREINPTTLDREIGPLIDSAYAAYALPKVTTDSPKELEELLTSFYVTCEYRDLRYLASSRQAGSFSSGQVEPVADEFHED